MLELVRKDARFFLAASLAALALRLVFVLHFPAVVDDSRLYADIAENWLQHGVYGITDSGQIMPTLSRLPGYPAFLAAIFAVFGWSNFRAVLLIQVLFDLGTCFLIADLTRRFASERAAKAAFLLAALCPFLANYSAAVLTETLEIFFTALALDLVLRGIAAFLRNPESKSTPVPLTWLGCGLSIGACILLRPDGGILFGAVGAYWFLAFVRSFVVKLKQTSGIVPRLRPMLGVGVILAIGAFAPLIPWTLRNLHTMHRFEPLAPRYANDSDELLMPGFNRWTKTWMADSTSVQEIYWRVPGDDIDVTRLPQRAFDSAQQRQTTEQLFADYNRDKEVTPELDARFAALAAARIHAAPLRYYVWLPALRIADMWLRPRTELLPSDPALVGVRRRPSVAHGQHRLRSDRISPMSPRPLPASGACAIHSASDYLLYFLLLRSLFLGTLENPEPRYTLECYPVVIVAAAVFLIGKSNRNHRKPA